MNRIMEFLRAIVPHTVRETRNGIFRRRVEIEAHVEHRFVEDRGYYVDLRTIVKERGSITRLRINLPVNSLMDEGQISIGNLEEFVEVVSAHAKEVKLMRARFGAAAVEGETSNDDG